MEKLLCQHSLLTGKVTVSLGGEREGWTGLHAGWEGRWMMDRELYGRTEGGTLSLRTPVRTLETSDTAAAAVHLLL